MRKFALFVLAVLLLTLLKMADLPEDGYDIFSTLDDLAGPEAPLPPPIDRDFEDILERDTLVVLTTYNSTSYFLYRGQALGYEYELLEAFADEHDVHLKVRVLPSRDSVFHYLNLGVGDVVANRVVPRAADSVRVAFTAPLYSTRPVLVQRQSDDSLDFPEGIDTVLEHSSLPAARHLADDDAEAVTLHPSLVRRPSELAGKEVQLRNRSPYVETLVEIEDEITGDIHIFEIDTVLSDEAVIRAVSLGEADYTVTSQNLAELKESYYTNLYARPILDEPHDVVWAVRSNATGLRDALSAWIEKNQRSALFNSLYDRYFIDRQGYRERIASAYLTSETGKLSPYDELLRRGAEQIGWDWRLLAAQAYQESRFKPRARSWAGAAGLLQLMPRTARQFGVGDVYDPAENVEGAVRFISWLERYWEDKIEDEEERLKFVLASYNTGHGHVQDARRLTQKYGGDDSVWADVSYWLLQKSKRQYYRDPVVKYGFARGLEPVMYVSHILERFDHYRTYVTDIDDAEDEPVLAANAS